jgi:hydroxymethylbilane synthase
VTARLSTHPDVAARTSEVLERLLGAGVDVEFVSSLPGSNLEAGAGPGRDPLGELRAGTVDLALVGIQSLRDSAADDLTTVAVLPREEVRDVLVTLSGRAEALHELPPGARVGLRGARRAAFLRAHRPDVEAVHLDEVPIGGGTADSELRAVILSALEARRAGLVEATVEALEVKAWLPEPGQGVLALVARHPIAEATAVDHLPTRTALRAELALLEALDARADGTLGCVAQPSGRWIRLWAAAASEDGRRLVRSDKTGPLDEPESLGTHVAREMQARGYELVLPVGA